MAGSRRSLLRPHLRAVAPYDPGPTHDELRRRYGPELLFLNWNEDLFGQPAELRRAAADALDEAALYPDDGPTGLRHALAAALGVAPNEVVLAHGAQALIFAIGAAFLDRTTAAVIPGSTYYLYEQATRNAGSRIVRVPNRGFEIDLDAVATAAAAERARLVWLCSPNNPTGLALDEAGWRELIERLPGDCVAVVDEAYIDFATGDRDRRPRDVAAGAPVIVLRTFSKVFGMAGLRLGYAVADPAVCDAVNALQGPFGINRVALAAGRAALAIPEFVERRRREVAAAREVLVRGVEAGGMATVPSEANFVLVDVGVHDVEFTARLARRGVAVRAGSEFGYPGFVRVTVAPEPVIGRAASRMCEVRTELRGREAVPAR